MMTSVIAKRYHGETPILWQFDFVATHIKLTEQTLTRLPLSHQRLRPMPASIAPQKPEILKKLMDPAVP